MSSVSSSDSGVASAGDVEIVDTSAISASDLKLLANAKRKLESKSLAMTLADLIGRPVEAGMNMLPANWRTRVHDATGAALEKAFDAAAWSLDDQAARRRFALRGNFAHKMAAVGAGVAGGAGGLIALPFELPLTTVLILRSIATIAREHGEDLSDPEARLNCLQVLSLGGRTESDDAAETGYYAIRGYLAHEVSAAAEFIARHGFRSRQAPAVVSLLSKIANRFGIKVSEKVAAGAVPVVGAVTGAAVNYVFIDHFQQVADGHFLVREMERKYGERTVADAYAEMNIGAMAKARVTSATTAASGPTNRLR